MAVNSILPKSSSMYECFIMCTVASNAVLLSYDGTDGVESSYVYANGYPMCGMALSLSYCDCANTTVCFAGAPAATSPSCGPSQLPAHCLTRIACHAVLLHGSVSEFKLVQPGCEHCK